MKILEVLTKSRKTGNLGEKAAAKYLRRHGYKIMKRNFVADGGEIDIIAENKTTVAFVEVKTRTLGKENPSEPRPASAVTPEKQRKIISAARFYLGGFQSKRLRLDIVEVYLNADKSVSKIVHIENAFNFNTAFENPKSRKANYIL